MNKTVKAKKLTQAILNNRNSKFIHTSGNKSPFMHHVPTIYEVKTHSSPNPVLTIHFIPLKSTINSTQAKNKFRIHKKKIKIKTQLINQETNKFKINNQLKNENLVSSKVRELTSR